MTPGTTNEIRVLHVDDEPSLTELVATFLAREEPAITVRTAHSAPEADEVLADDEIDCVVSDYDMAGRNGLEFLADVRASHPELPFILFTGKGSEEVASEAISAGVTDYLQKERGTSHYAVLANRITNAVEQYRAKRAVAASQKRLSLFIEQSPLGVLEYNEDFKIVRLNERGEEILGYTEAELAGHTWEHLVTENSYDNVDRVTDRLAAATGGYHSIDENVRGDGERIICEWHNRVVTDDDEVVAVFSLFQDITERRTQQRELERYRKIVQAASSTVLTIDTSSTIQSANPSVERMFGYEPEALVGESLTLLMPDDLAADHAVGIERYLETGERALDWDGAEFVGKRRDGSTFPVSVTFGEGTYEGERYFVGILRDVTERVQQAEELRERERELAAQNERLETFASVVSHDLRNPLAVAEGRLELARGDPSEEHFDVVERAHRRMRALITDLLTLARADAGGMDREPVALTALVDDCWQTVETGPVRLHNTAERTVLANRSRLRQLLGNLFRNSVEHGAGGQLSGSGDTDRSESITVRIGDLEDGFYVGDDGPGIAAADREAVFETGYSTSPEGTGIGLSIVEGVVEAHGWEIDIVEDSAGTVRFEITGVEFVEE